MLELASAAWPVSSSSPGRRGEGDGLPASVLGAYLEELGGARRSRWWSLLRWELGKVLLRENG